MSSPSAKTYRRWFYLLALALAFCAVDGVGAYDRGSLWQVVRGCVALKRSAGIAFPCTEVSLPGAGNAGSVILKSPPYRSEFLVTPAIHIEGIESADVLEPDASQLWQAAWNARALVERALGHSLPASAVGLVVNSAGSRTQDQLHIHVDCASRTTQRVLKKFLPRATDAWQNLPETIAGNRYVVRLLGSSNLAAANPFELLMSALPRDKAIASASLAVIGVGSEHDASDFLVLASFTDKPAESLLDHTCQ